MVTVGLVSRGDTVIAAARMNKNTARKLMRRIKREAPHVKIEHFRQETPSFSYLFEVVDTVTGESITVRDGEDWPTS